MINEFIEHFKIFIQSNMLYRSSDFTVIYIYNTDMYDFNTLSLIYYLLFSIL